MRIAIPSVLVAALVLACSPFLGIADRFPAILADVRNMTEQPVVVVIAADTVNRMYTPRPEVRAYVVGSGERGWTHSLLTHGETGSISAYSTECALLDREELTDGEYEAAIQSDGSMDVTFVEAGPSVVKPAMIQTDDSCGFAAGFLELPAGPFPTDGLAPPGDLPSLQRGALAAVGLEIALDVVLRAPPRLRWLPDFNVLETVSVRNGSDGTIVIPNELTVLRWDGSDWARERCMFELGDDLPRKRICGGANDTQVEAGGELGGGRGEVDVFFDWPAREAEPGTYALLVPVRSIDKSNVGPSAGVCAIVTVTSSP